VIDIAMTLKPRHALRRTRMSGGGHLRVHGGGTDGAIYKTTDGGATWKKLTKACPMKNGGDTGRIGLGYLSQGSEYRLRAVQHEKGGIYRSEDKARHGKNERYESSPSYYSQVRVIPITICGFGCWAHRCITPRTAERRSRSQRGKKVFMAIFTRCGLTQGFDPHHHRFGWRHPWSYDDGKSWDFINTIAIGQFLRSRAGQPETLQHLRWIAG